MENQLETLNAKILKARRIADGARSALYGYAEPTGAQYDEIKRCDAALRKLLDEKHALLDAMAPGN